MKIKITILFLIFQNYFYAQYFGEYTLSEFDTIIDYKETFFKDSKIIAKNENIFLGYDTLIKSWIEGTEKFIYGRINVPVYTIQKLKHGPWIFYYNKKFNECGNSNFTYYKLINYNRGYSLENQYLFDSNNNLLKIFLNYPKMDDSRTISGFKIIYFDENEKIKAVELKHFIDDKIYENVFYFNYTEYYKSTYYKNYKLKNFTFSDEINKDYVTIRVNKSGIIRYELINNNKKSYLIKRNKKGKIKNL